MHSPQRTRGQPSLKRSASTASLPTPPRTRPRRRVMSKAAIEASPTDSDLRGAQGISSDESDDELPSFYKKRRVSPVREQDEEDAFWANGEDDEAKPNTADDETRSRSRSSSPVPLLERRRQNQQSNFALASPPPSHRKKASPAGAMVGAMARLPTMVAGGSPKTPPSRSKKPNVLKRDSPDNPFLETPVGSEASDVEGEESNEIPRTSFEERPTVTYVHRGIKKEFPNPNYDHENKRPLPINPNSLLPPEHPDYEPDFRCLPKILFPVPAGRQRKTRKRALEKVKSASPKRSEWDSSDDERPKADQCEEIGEFDGATLLRAPGPARGR